MKLKEGHIPLYFQFYLMLKNQIMLGDVEPGSRVPNIDELHSLYGVSHATVRKAMALLEKDHLIIKKRGMGTIIRDEVDVVMWSPEDSRDNLLQGLTSMSFRTLSSGWIEPPPRIWKLMQNQKDALNEGLIYHLLRVWESPNERWRRRVSNVFIPAYLVNEYGESNLENSYIIIEVLKKHSYSKLKISNILRPWLCDVDTAELLGLSDGTPVFHRTINIRNPDNQVILISEWIATTTSFVREMELPVGDIDIS